MKSFHIMTRRGTMRTNKEMEQMNITKIFLKLNRIDTANLLVLRILMDDPSHDVSEFIPKLSPKYYLIDGTDVRPKKAMIDLLIMLSRMEAMAPKSKV